MEGFNASLPIDRRMWAEDLRGSAAYAAALARAGVLTADEASTIQAGLEAVGKEWAAGTFTVVPGDEDIHTANERRLTEIVGPVGGKLHTGRSRNDQVATDTRLWLEAHLRTVTRPALADLIKAAVSRAEAEADVVMPGYTHLQAAQAVRWGHWLLAHAAAWQRDDARLADALPRIGTLPLGSGALAGNPFGVDRVTLSADLGFGGRVCPNSMDAVSDRDYVAETLFIAALTLTHLSRWAEDLIIYSSPGYGFVQCADAYATGSSLMPQKKNPDALELIRGKAGVAIGNLTGILAVIKGTPLTYNKDLQEAWGLLFGGLDALDACVRIATGVLSTLRINPTAMAAGLSSDMLATDLAEYLVRKGVPFRETHHVAGAAVKLAEDRRCGLADLTPADLRTLHPLFGDDVAALWDFGASADSRDTEGGASKRSVLEQVEKLKAYLKEAGLD
jgi:argininosuccinate lyase